MLLKNAPANVVKDVYDACFESAIRIALQTNVLSELQDATECLAYFLSYAKQEVLERGGDPGDTTRSLVDVALRLLDLESPVSVFVESYILQLILHLRSQMAPHIRKLVAALVRRMQSSELKGQERSSLLLIFARLVHNSMPDVDQFIDLLISVSAKDHKNSFVYVMSEWAKHQWKSLIPNYRIKVTTTALALLLSTRHPELEVTFVPGHLFKPFAATTSRAKVPSPQWTLMRLRTKILALLADVLIGIQEQAWAERDEDEYEALHADADPLNKVNLGDHLSDIIVKFSQTKGPSFVDICQRLTEAQQNAVQMVIEAQQNAVQMVLNR